MSTDFKSEKKVMLGKFRYFSRITILLTRFKHDYCNLLLELIASNGNYFAINTTLWNFLHSSDPLEKNTVFYPVLQKTAWISHLIICIEIPFMRIIWASGYKCGISKIYTWIFGKVKSRIFYHVQSEWEIWHFFLTELRRYGLTVLI